VIRSASIFDVAQVLLFELNQPLRAHGIAIRVIARSDQGLIDAGQRGQKHTQRTFGKRREPGRLDTPPVFPLPIGANLTAYIVTKELNQEGEQAIRLSIPGIVVTQQEASPGQSHIEVRIRRSSRVNGFFTTIPLTQEKHGGTSRINNQ
jgi:hypothetical protein